MPVIKNGRLIDDNFYPVQEDGDSLALASDPKQILSEGQWLAAQEEGVTGSAVQLEPEQSPAPLLDQLDKIELIAINFPVFTDGRGFSYARELRDSGYRGEIRATGNFLHDQLFYLSRCGFDAFTVGEDTPVEQVNRLLGAFSDSYQASANQPLPLFRRRHLD